MVKFLACENLLRTGKDNGDAKHAVFRLNALVRCLLPDGIAAGCFLSFRYGALGAVEFEAGGDCEFIGTCEGIGVFRCSEVAAGGDGDLLVKGD